MLMLRGFVFSFVKPEGQTFKLICIKTFGDQSKSQNTYVAEIVSFSLLGFFLASFDLIKNLPILVAILLGLSN